MLHTILLLINLITHPFFVSVTEIKHNAKEKRLEVSCRMFYDDLEHTLENTYKTQFDILKPADKQKANELIADYVKKHLILKADGKALALNYLGYQIEEDGCWAYFEVPKIAKLKQLDVQNDLLFSAHSSQTNILQVTLNGKEQSTKLDNPESKAVFK